MGAAYDDDIAQGMNYQHWLQIKRVKKKLCNNNKETKKGQEGYSPSYKFDYMWRCLIYNINFLPKHVELDICGDETCWATASYGEAGAGLTFQMTNKPGITKGGHPVLVSDIHCIRT